MNIQTVEQRQEKIDEIHATLDIEERQYPWLRPVKDARWLLEEVYRLQAELAQVKAQRDAAIALCRRALAELDEKRDSTVVLNDELEKLVKG